ncbi:hypothetical protein [Brevundimonas sp.]|uniref:hypothetical protein n=1 Tax=Brevundimonas sp. TaxID=1871086 RepID=UPI003510D818
MHRIDTSDALGDQFNDDTNVANPTTRVSAAWLNDVQESLGQAIEGAGIALVKGSGAQLLAAIIALARTNGVPVGTRISFDGTAVPAGYLAADGAEHLRADYPALVAHYLAEGRSITGSDADHFVMPNYEGYFERAASSDASVDPDGPREAGDAPQLDAFKSHLHSVSPPASDSEGAAGRTVTGNTGTSENLTSYNTGSTGDVETRPKNVPFLWCIKY